MHSTSWYLAILRLSQAASDCATPDYQSAGARRNTWLYLHSTTLQAAASGEAGLNVSASSQVTMGYNRARLQESCGNRKDAAASYKVGCPLFAR